VFRHPFDADPDPDTNFHVDAKSDPDPDPNWYQTDADHKADPSLSLLYIQYVGKSDFGFYF
jgi:hypothetical protein